jgi:hypothetical protein
MTDTPTDMNNEPISNVDADTDIGADAATDVNSGADSDIGTDNFTHITEGSDPDAGLSIEEMQAKYPLQRMEPLGPEDKEAERWNREADEIEKWARTVPGGPEGYMANPRKQMGWEQPPAAQSDTANETQIDPRDADIAG